ncbi:hypothetical protein L6452_38870 [Arctium lappa]|uniref:Uncharacterized protein n=1 Tax=Arctium lappa TaxID=4217 RepID=A0ACB8XQQ2_ARCLA|nr:hypothetical protein L6452_38870 [Arctium lappa]
MQRALKEQKPVNIKFNDDDEEEEALVFNRIKKLSASTLSTSAPPKVTSPPKKVLPTPTYALPHDIKDTIGDAIKNMEAMRRKVHN